MATMLRRRTATFCVAEIPITTGRRHRRRSCGDASSKKPQFGTRYLVDPSAVFEHNAWDNVEWDAGRLEEAKRIVGEQLAACSVDTARRQTLVRHAAGHWDAFYAKNRDKFFKDRRWLLTEFPELEPDARTHSADKPMRVLEVGCGVGNAVFPLKEHVADPSLLHVYACDFSRAAIELLEADARHDPAFCTPFVCDVTGDFGEVPGFPVAERSLDAILLLFVLCALPPEEVDAALQRLHRLLKPGGVFLFRDYGRYDLAQLRFKKPESILEENLYRRGDNTLVRFFDEREVEEMFVSKLGCEKELLWVDNRLIVNRAKLLKMYRVWLLGKFRKRSD